MKSCCANKKSWNREASVRLLVDVSLFKMLQVLPGIRGRESRWTPGTPSAPGAGVTGGRMRAPGTVLHCLGFTQLLLDNTRCSSQNLQRPGEKKEKKEKKDCTLGFTTTSAVLGRAGASQSNWCDGWRWLCGATTGGLASVTVTVIKSYPPGLQPTQPSINENT